MLLSLDTTLGLDGFLLVPSEPTTYNKNFLVSQFLLQSFITTVVTIFSLILTVLLDESPRWLLANGHFSRALEIIQ